MYREVDEQTLARFCSQGDKTAEGELYRRYAARVYTLCRRYAVDDDEAKDLMQESLIQVLDKINTYEFKGKGSLYGWIRKITVNKAVNYITRHRWRSYSLDFMSHDNIPEPTEEEMESIPQEKLIEWISSLPSIRKAVFNMYCIDGYSHKEIANLLRISEKGAASMLAKARKQLKEKIRQYLKEQEL